MNNLLITAGPTREYIDPVRFISNSSSGKMGYAIANAARKIGWKVTLISGPVNLEKPKGVKFVQVETAKEMMNECLKCFSKTDIVIMAAAVSDFRPKTSSKHKIKKVSKKYDLELVQNPDILKKLVERKRKDQIVVGFSLETKNLLKNAKEKIKKKGCDWLVANHSSAIGSDTNKVILFSKDFKKYDLPMMTKDELAMVILSYLIP